MAVSTHRVMIFEEYVRLMVVGVSGYVYPFEGDVLFDLSRY